jgi:DNA-binding IclR family transcriptional regulator
MPFNDEEPIAVLAALSKAEARLGTRSSVAELSKATGLPSEQVVAACTELVTRKWATRDESGYSFKITPEGIRELAKHRSGDTFGTP